ncbi:MAG: hypothetical protein H0T76_10190 [Nannocystis sp.]|nr:hypothetical protein [Nannocystis sp.]MBA3546841.1 hypothetical protein [Nannocystis sp.]
MGTRNILALLLVGACQAPPVGHTGFGSMPEVTTAPAASTSGTSSGSGSSGTSTGEDSGSGGGDTMSEPPRDLGIMPDFGVNSPVGCKGKIDFLFVISRQANMQYRQAQLAAAFPQFIDTIQSRFADFDYHIMVVDGDGEDNNDGIGWGNPACTALCATPGCSVGDPCCYWNDPDQQGKPCCTDPDYPCQDLDLVTTCDWAWGAGTVFPAGVSGEANKHCPIDGGRRYLVKGQTNLTETFACIATVGASGYDMLGQALTAAMQSNISDPGGCNNGFLRKDALLMVTFIATNPDEDSAGTPDKWAQAVLDAKHGDDKSVVMFAIGGPAECKPYDRICQLITMFPYHHGIFVEEPNYGPGFVEAASLLETACAGFTPAPG